MAGGGEKEAHWPPSCVSGETSNRRTRLAKHERVSWHERCGSYPSKLRSSGPFGLSRSEIPRLGISHVGDQSRKRATLVITDMPLNLRRGEEKGRVW